ncbi:MAG TPA: DUF962 domain-containing protein [Oxalicibacterium sp.]|nr:DUF962 domain-containing protein [Oxalicibacterium sp.]HTH45407.1 DUF962 domain-containing protein [Oxalicibacterium sp.]
MSALTEKTTHGSGQSFAAFYARYLTEHADRHSRQLHFLGSTLALVFMAMFLLTANAWWLLAAVVAFYGFSWSGHFLFEKNWPRSFRQPLYAFASAWLLYWQMLTGQVSF